MSVDKNYLEKKLFVSSADQLKLISVESGIFSVLELHYFNLRIKLLDISAKFYVSPSFDISITNFSNSKNENENQVKYKVKSSISKTLDFIKDFDYHLSKGKFYFSKEPDTLNYLCMFIFCSENIDLAKQYFNTIPKKYLAKTIYYFSFFLKNWNSSHISLKLSPDIEPINIKNTIELAFFDTFVDICKDKINFVSLKEMESLHLRSIYFLKPFFNLAYYSYFESLYGKFSDNDKQEILSFISKTNDLKLRIPEPKQFINFSISKEKFFLKEQFNIYSDSKLKIILPYVSNFYSILFKSILNNFEVFKSKYALNLKYLAFRTMLFKSNSMSTDVFLDKFSFSIFLYFVEKYNSFCFYQLNKYTCLNFDRNKINFENLDKISKDYKTYFLTFFTESNDSDMINSVIVLFKYTEDLYPEYNYLFEDLSNINGFLIFPYLYENNKIFEYDEEGEAKREAQRALHYSNLIRQKLVPFRFNAYVNKDKSEKLNTMTTINTKEFKILLEQYKLKKNLDQF